MAQITATEHVVIGGLPLDTPAWRMPDVSSLYSGPAWRGADLHVPFAEGQIPRRRWVDARPVSLPLAVNGELDPDGAAHPNPGLAGLRANLDTLLAALRPRQTSDEGTVELEHHLTDGTIRRAACVVFDVRAGILVPTRARVTIEATIPGGLLRATTATQVTSASVAADTVGTLVVPNAGTADQYDLILTLTGTATSVRVRNVTWDPSDGTWVQFAGSLGGGVDIDTADFTATRDGSSVVGLVSHAGHERWLPLQADGDNTLEIAPSGGSATLTVSHFPAYQ